MMNSFNLNVISYYVIDIFSVIFREMIREEKFDCPAIFVQRSKVAPNRRGEENYVTRRKKKKRRRRRQTKESARAGFRRRNCHAQWQQRWTHNFAHFPGFPEKSVLCPRIPYNIRKLCHLSKSGRNNVGRKLWETWMVFLITSLAKEYHPKRKVI